MAGLEPDRKRQAAVGRQAEGVPAAGRVVPSARWYRFALATITLGMLTGFYGTLPAAFIIFHFGNVAAAAHYSVIQDLIALTALRT
jgi:ascorbate-specific PTS system EIIC-type component UlaA